MGKGWNISTFPRPKIKNKRKLGEIIQFLWISAGMREAGRGRVIYCIGILAPTQGGGREEGWDMQLQAYGHIAI